MRILPAHGCRNSTSATLGFQCLTKGTDTVGEPPRTEIGVPNMPSLKAKKPGKLTQEKVLLEL